MSVFTHVTLGTNDVDKARTFYDNVLSILGLKRITDLGENGSIWGRDAPSFFVMNPNDGQPASVGNGNMVSFEASNRAVVDEFHAAVLSAGGQNEGLPGTRDWAPNAYGAYVRDLDGNKLAVYCFKAE
ncbi:VOC family protein [Psychrobacter frigidicola]|uniref:VOC family protein n=1 Tax=Psychrobacter frigidicola TaxID=45611 RepID=UPI001917C1D3|nr:VOC family protein [Psychrobacter frigidicola]